MDDCWIEPGAGLNSVLRRLSHLRSISGNGCVMYDTSCPASVPDCDSDPDDDDGDPEEAAWYPVSESVL